MSRLETNMFFICGAPKSGTTWLQRSMNSHPEIVCKGEGHFIEKFVLPLAGVFREYNSKLQLVADSVYNGNPCYKRFTNEEFYEICHEFIYKRIADGEKNGARFFGDKTPRYYEFVKNIKNIYPNGKIICILRDPRDLVVSKFYHAYRAGVKDVFVKGSNARISQIKLTTQQFVRCVESIESAIKSHRNDIFVTSYEKMTDNPSSELKKIFSFLGALYSEDIVYNIVQENSFHSMTGRQTGEMDENSFIRKGVVGDWVNEITSEEENMIRNDVLSKVHVDYFQ
jgi:hypothetical protein